MKFYEKTNTQIIWLNDPSQTYDFSRNVDKKQNQIDETWKFSES